MQAEMEDEIVLIPPSEASLLIASSSPLLALPAPQSRLSLDGTPSKNDPPCFLNGGNGHRNPLLELKADGERQRDEERDSIQERERERERDSVEDGDLNHPKKRAETWTLEEIRVLISLRKDMSALFNNSKSNRHLWEQISVKMKERGYDRTPTMCTDKWRNLIKDYNRAMRRHGRPGAAKLSFFKDLEDVIGRRDPKQSPYSAPVAKLASAPPKEFGGSPLNLEKRLGQEGQPAASVISQDANISNCMSSWNWRDCSPNGQERRIPPGRIISVRYGEMIKRVGIDGTAEAIKDAIRCAFRLRSGRALWLEDEEGTVRVKLYIHDEGKQVTGTTEEKTLYNEDDFRLLLAERGWKSFQEVGGYKSLHCIDDLQSSTLYQRGGSPDSTSL